MRIIFIDVLRQRIRRFNVHVCIKRVPKFLARQRNAYTKIINWSMHIMNISKTSHAYAYNEYAIIERTHLYWIQLFRMFLAIKFQKTTPVI